MLYGTLAASPTPTQLRFNGYVPAFILIDDVDAANVISSVLVEIAGETVQNVTDQTAISVFAKIGMNPVNGAIGGILKISDGRIEIPGKECVITLNNAGAGTPNIYYFSGGFGSKAVQFAQGAIQDKESRSFSGIEYLTFDDSNFDQASITFNNGHKEAKLTLVELRSLLVMEQATDANGELAGYNVIDLIGSDIAEITLFANGGAISYYTIDI